MDHEIEIDLRQVLLSIRKAWKWIVGCTVILSVLSFCLVYFSTAKYSATAVIAVTRPRYVANFDPKFLTVAPSVTINKAFLDLANSDEIVETVFTEWAKTNRSNIRLDDFRKNVAAATNGSDQTIIYLSIIDKDPQNAARLANLWAENYIKRANTIYSGQDQNQLVYFQTQLSDAELKMKQADQALVDFQNRNDIAFLNNELKSNLENQQANLQKQADMKQAQEDGRTLLARLANLPSNSSLNSSDRLDWVLLRSQFYATANNTPGSSTNSTVQLQIPALSTEEAITVGDQKQAIQQWIDALEKQKVSSQADLKDLQANIISLQGKIQTLNNESSRLQLDHDLATEVVTSLTRKTNEVSISLQDQTGDVRIAASAIPPVLSESNHLTRTVAIGVGIGAVLGWLISLMLNWWKNTK